MLIKPNAKRVLLRVAPNQTIVKGSLLIPTEKQFPEAVVLEIADDVTEVAIGDRVLFERPAAFHIVDRLMLIREDNIVLKIDTIPCQ